MALQLGVRRGFLAGQAALSRSTHVLAAAATARPSVPQLLLQQHHQQQRFLSGKDMGDVIGIDLGTTNSCVAIMVRTGMLPQDIFFERISDRSKSFNYE